MKNLILLFLVIFTVLIPENAFAHGSHGTGFMAGFTHSAFGVDHLLAILGISIFGFSVFNDKQWLPSASFIIAMFIGGLLGIAALGFGITEPIIGLSVIVIGALISYEVKLPDIAAGLLFAFIGFFHGHAHGTEMPQDTNIPLFILGFISAALLISALGWGITKLIKQNSQVRLLGAFLAGIGLALFL